MSILFWICWVSEFCFAIWWVATELKLTTLPPNPFSFLSIGYILLVLAIRFGAGFITLSNILVFIPAIPLLLMGFIVIAAWLSKSKWN